MKAKMVGNLAKRYRELMPEEYDSEADKFLNSIDGKVVDLIFTHGDAFEKNDNNIWLPGELWNA